MGSVKAPAKRLDLQGIRGVAIIAVLLFHLRPLDFPAGFLGVDMFFVLSGFLMYSILSKEHVIGAEAIGKFYIRRFKRIVPLYTLLLGVLFVVATLIFLQSEVERFLVDLFHAALFGTNIAAVLENHDYWSEVFDSNVLTHTWSLGVEIQFYLVVPFLLLGQRALGRRWAVPYLLGIVTVSLCQYDLVSPVAAFNLPSSRVWQFLAGALAFEWSVEEEKTMEEEEEGSRCLLLKSDAEEDPEMAAFAPKEKKVSSLGCLLSSILAALLIALLIGSTALVFLPIDVVRLLAVLSTAVLIALGTEGRRQTPLLSNPVLSYLGDVSYVVYLVHWPVIIVWKSYWDECALTGEECLACLALTLVLSVLLHHTAESFFISSSTSTAVVFVAVVYAALALAVVSNLPSTIALWRDPPPSTHHESNATVVNIAKAIAWNERESRLKQNRMAPFKECVRDAEAEEWTGPHEAHKEWECVDRGTGNISVLVVGNSISHRSAPVLHSILRGHISTFRFFAHCGRAVIGEGALSANQTDTHLEAPIENIRTDDAMIKFRNLIDNLKMHSKNLIYDEVYPSVPKGANVARSLAKRLRRGQSLEDMKVDYVQWKERLANYWRRLDSIPWGPHLVRHNTSGRCVERRTPGRAGCESKFPRPEKRMTDCARS